MYLQEEIRTKTQIFLHLESHCQKEQDPDLGPDLEYGSKDPDSYQNGTDPVDSWLSLSLPLVIVADRRVSAVGVLVVYCRCMSTVVRSCCLLIVVHRLSGGYRL